MNHHEEFYPNEKFKLHTDPVHRPRCSHLPKSSSDDQPLMILADDEVRHVSNVYRREKNFNHKTFPLNTNDDPQRTISDVPETLFDRFCRKTVDFISLILTVVHRRDQLLQCSYPFEKNLMAHRPATNTKYNVVDTICFID